MLKEITLKELDFVAGGTDPDPVPPEVTEKDGATIMTCPEGTDLVVMTGDNTMMAMCVPSSED